MKRLVVLKIIVLCFIFGLSFYVMRFTFYMYSAKERFNAIPSTTRENPLISAIRGLLLPSDWNTTDCMRLFVNNTPAYSFSMSEDFQRNIEEFLAAVSNSPGGRRLREGHSFEIINMYKFLHYITSKLKFVRTVCESGMNFIRYQSKSNWAITVWQCK